MLNGYVTVNVGRDLTFMMMDYKKILQRNFSQAAYKLSLIFVETRESLSPGKVFCDQKRLCLLLARDISHHNEVFWERSL